ncbi:MAG: hypothetical protein OXI24_18080 [Candidatus Poribacteria bacterium]|nr:hypothetical protein [Candidatus Poribacteria bacterium]
MTKTQETLAVGHTERLNASGAEVNPEITSDTSVGMAGRAYCVEGRILLL